MSDTLGSWFVNEIDGP